MPHSLSSFRRFAARVAVLLFLVVHGSALAQTASLLTVQSFGPAPDGTGPYAAMIQGADGNLYGTTPTGGANGTGTVFRFNPFTNAYAILHDFSALDAASNTNADGAGPRGKLVRDQGGNLYGTASYGGAYDEGTIFELATDGNFITLHAFSGTDGSGPYGGLLLAADGNFYGTTSAGNGSSVVGTVFKMTPSGVLTTLHDFTGTDGSGPRAALIQAQDNNLYGTTIGGGANGDGTVFEITTSGTFTSRYSFNDTDGSSPQGALVQGGGGNFFGTTESGGVNSNGTVFQFTPAGILTTLYQFAGGQPGASDGSNPFSDLVRSPDGQLYGTTYAGGSADQHGTIFEITNAGVLTTLYRFTGGNDGSNPTAALTLDQRGDFFGVTGTNGVGGGGTIFALNVHGILSFTTDATPVSENAGSVTLTVNRAGGNLGAVGVNYATADGTGVAGTDYAVTTGTLNWADGDVTPKTITVPITDRHIYDGTARAFTVALSACTGGAVLQFPAVETVTINENDTLPTQPTITLDSPPDAAMLFAGAPLNLAASVNDPDNILMSVQFTIDGVSVGSTVAAGPYVLTTVVPLVSAVHTLAAIATDNLGRTSTNTHSFSVRTPASGDAVPSATILTDLNNRLVGVGQTLPIAATATTSNGDPLQRVDFYAGGSLIASFDGSGAPISTSGVTRPPGSPVRAATPVPLLAGTVFQTTYQVPAAAKLVNLLVVAFTKLGVSTVSNAATIHPIDPSVARPPVVGLSGLADGATIPVSAPITLGINVTLPTASAVSRLPGGVHRQAATTTLSDLALYLNAALLQHGFGPDAGHPGFTFTPPAAGDYVVNAIATDTDGVSGVAMPITLHAVGDPTVLTLEISGDGRAQYGVENGVVLVRRTGNLSSALNVSYAIRGTAKSGVDFKALSGTLVIPSGASKAKIKIKPLRNKTNTGTLKAKIVLRAPTDGSYQLGGTTLVKVRVVGTG